MVPSPKSHSQPTMRSGNDVETSKKDSGTPSSHGSGAFVKSAVGPRSFTVAMVVAEPIAPRLSVTVRVTV